MPGMWQTYASYLAPGANNLKAIAFQAVDAGFDVWIGNNRGTRYSVGNITSEFDWVDQAEHDLPNMIEVVLKYSNYDKLDYIGYDTGSTQMFYAMS